MGISIEAIHEFHILCQQDGDEAIKKRLEILLKQLDAANEELKQAKQRVEYLNHKIEKERKVIDQIIPDDKNPSKKTYHK